jgi:hypothetical protein
MELLKRIIGIVDANLIYCLIPIILTLIFVELIFKNRFETKKALNVFRVVIISYVIITWVTIFMELAFYPEESIFRRHTSGPYKITYWIMLFCALILPFTVLIKRVASKFGYVLLIAISMKIGFYFERFVILITSFQGDYLPENGKDELMGSIFFGIGMVFIQGIIIAILTLAILEVLKSKKTIKKEG